MTVYVEVVIFNNFIIDLLLITAVLYCRRKKIKKIRVTITAIIGCLVATGYAVAPSAAQIAIRILLAPVMTLMFDRYKSVKDYVISLAIFALLTFALGGITSGLGYLTGVDLNNYIVLGLTASGALAGMVAIKLIVAKRAKTVRKTCEVLIMIDSGVYTAKAMCDSGNTLTDDVSGLPVIILSGEFTKKLTALDTLNLNKIEGYIQIETVAGKGEMPLIKIDEIVVGEKYCAAYGALSGKHFDGYDIILQNTLF